jgi:predicted transcriptional regulator
MRTETIQYFDDSEEELVCRLVRAGAKPSTAKALVFLTGNGEATAAEIERGTGMRQPDVSTALRLPIKRGWIHNGKKSVSATGRSVKMYILAQPLPDIMDALGKEKRQKAAKNQLAFVRKLREFSPMSALQPDARAS